MKTRITDLAVKAVAVAGLAAGLAFGSGIAAEEACGPDNLFARYPGPLNGRTGVDPCDPYAPAGFDGPASATGNAGGAAAAKRSVATEDAGLEWGIPPMPRLPGEPY